MDIDKDVMLALIPTIAVIVSAFIQSLRLRDTKERLIAVSSTADHVLSVTNGTHAAAVEQIRQLNVEVVRLRAEVARLSDVAHRSRGGE